MPLASQSHGRSVTKMVIVVVKVFLVGNTLNFINWNVKDTELGKNVIFICVTDFALLLSPGINIVIYAVFNTKFRIKFFDFFCSACRGKNGIRRNAMAMDNRSRNSRRTVQTSIFYSQSNSSSRPLFQLPLMQTSKV